MTVLVAITGGSGSGKSTLAAALQAALPPGAAVTMSEDWYYRDCSAFPNFDPATFDFDDIVIRDHALLIAHMRALRAGQAVTAPEYDFVTHSRKTDAGVAVAPAEVVIVEGSHLLCAAEVAATFDLRVYLDTPDDVRFIRRLLRDQAERGRTARSVVDQYLATVRPAHERLTGPSRGRADLVIVDVTTTVDRPDPAAIAGLAAPLLEHPLFKALRDRSQPPSVSPGLGPGVPGAASRS